jgi:hypothetical protein
MSSLAKMAGRKALGALSLCAAPRAARLHPLCRAYALGTAGATAAAAAGGGQVLRVMGYDVPWIWIIGASLGSGALAYAYTTTHMAKEDRQPLAEVIMAAPIHLPAGVFMTNQGGKKRDVAKALAGSHAAVAFVALHSADGPLMETVAK